MNLLYFNRLVNWAETNEKMYEEQAGFRKGKSTIDQIVILQSIVQKYLTKRRGIFYCIFLQFAKAFYSRPHLCLWYRLINGGVHGKKINVLKSMYSKLQLAVITPDGLGDYFCCATGTRHGCQMSPFLFTFYLNEFIECCHRLDSLVYI